MWKNPILLCWTGALFFQVITLSPAISDENEFYATLQAASGVDTPGQIQGLELSQEELVVDDSNFVVIQGTFERIGWSLLSETELIHKSSPQVEKHFSYRVELRGVLTPIRFVAVGPLGETQYQMMQIHFPEWETKVSGVRSEAQILEAEKKLSFKALFSPGLGVTYLTMTQAGRPDFSLTGITIKANVRKPLPWANWDGHVGGYITAVVFLKKPSDRSARFAGFNFRLSYLFPQISDPWVLSVAVGGYYATTWVTPNDFGYSNVYGPQLYPVVRRKLKNDKILSAYLKFSPITSGISILNLSSRELALGFSMDGFRIKKYPIFYTFDFANLAINLTGVKLQNNSITLGLGTGF